MNITPSMRQRVAEAVTGREHRWGNGEDFGERPGRCLFRSDSLRAHLLRWEPDEDVYQENALVQKVAQLIVSYSDNRKAMIDASGGDVRPYASKVSMYMADFIKALATGSVSDLEMLCFELLEGGKDG